MAQNTCIADGCDKPQRALALCSTHYNQTLPDRHYRYTITCVQCGRQYDSSRKLGKYCSLACRDRARRVEADARRAAEAARPRGDAPAPLDQRSALRRAVEDGDHAATLAAIRAQAHPTPEGCWEWQRRVDRSGYPVARIARREMYAHRLALEAHLGAPLGEQPAHHACANAKCVNPEHLQPVTHRENNAEMLARNYMVRRIEQLEDALRTLAPDHALLAEVGLPKP